MFKNLFVSKKDKRETLIAAAQLFIEVIKQNKSIPPIASSLILEANEKAFLEEDTTFFEPRAVRKSTGSGAGFRVMKGVYLGGYSGRSESTQEWRDIDQGTLTITNKKIVFRGSKENKTVAINKIISSSNTMDSIQLTMEEKNKPILFQVKNPYMWAAVIHICKGANPLDLGKTELDIQFK